MSATQKQIEFSKEDALLTERWFKRWLGGLMRLVNSVAAPTVWVSATATPSDCPVLSLQTSFKPAAQLSTTVVLIPQT